jgi:hypothetical protein
MTLACPIKNTLIHSYEDDFSYDLDIVITAVAYRNKEKFDNDEYVTLEDSTELTRTVHCKKGKKWCNEITVYEVDSVDFQFYGFDITFANPGQACRVSKANDKSCRESQFVYRMRLYHLNPEYTNFESAWKYFFILAIVVVLFMPYEGFLTKLRRLPYTSWSLHQKWVVFLAWGLILFDDPTILFRVYFAKGAAAAGLSTFSVVCLSFELSAIMCFWICLFSDIWATGRRNQLEGAMQPITVGLDVASSSATVGSGPNPMLFRQFRSWNIIARGVNGVRHLGRTESLTTAYWPKILLCGIIWIIMACAYTYIKIRQTADPTYYYEQDDNYFQSLKATLLVLVSFYLLWLLYHMYKSLCYLQSLQKHYIFVLVVTFFSIILIMCGIYAQAYYFMGESIVFFIFFSMVNVYVWMLLLVYTPRAMPGEGGIDNMNHALDITSNGGEWDTSTDEDGL